jgi:hypothetical protein
MHWGWRMSPDKISLGLIAGILLLLIGRKLFWFFVAVIGFLWGLQIASYLLHEESEVVILAIAVAMGLLGAVLAVIFQHVVVGFAGFLAGVHLIMSCWSFMNWPDYQHVWMFSLVGGLFGAIMALFLLNWALVVLSSLVGAGLICQALPLNQEMTVFCFVVFSAAGILVQSHLIQRPVPAV